LRKEGEVLRGEDAPYIFPGGEKEKMASPSNLLFFLILNRLPEKNQAPSSFNVLVKPAGNPEGVGLFWKTLLK